MPNEIDTEIEEDLDDVLDAPEEGQKSEATPPQDELKAAMAELAKSQATLTKQLKPEPTQPKEPELTQEQKDEFWGIYNPEKTNKDFMKKWFRLNPDATAEDIAEVKALWNDAQAGLVRQAVIGSKHLFTQELKKRDEQLARMEEYISKQEAKEVRSRFTESYPVLADKKYSKILTAKAKELSTQEFTDEAAFFKALAEGAAEVIRDVVPTFDLGAQTKPKQSAGTSPRLPRTSAGGTGGTGGGKQEALSVKGDATDDFLQDD